jgi:hypothetical protein
VAKDRFYRTKPHVNVATTRWLAQRGISPLGVHQITHGLVVTNPTDRALVAETMAEQSEQYFTITIGEGRIANVPRS